MKCINIWMVGCMLLSLGAKAQQVVRLDLQRTIEIANDSSLSAFRYQNLYLSGYWEYRTYKANRLPSLTLDLTPAKYYRYITQRYDSNEDMDVYREQQMFSASGGLSIKQNLDWTGGTFYIDSELDFMRNFGDSKSTQYSTIPVRVGYQQSLLGYNAFRWDRKIEPLKYEKVKKLAVIDGFLTRASGYQFYKGVGRSGDLFLRTGHGAGRLPAGRGECGVQ